MESLILLLPVLGCLAMGAVMVMMMRGQHRQTPQHTIDPATQEEINRLRAEIALLKYDQADTHDNASETGSKP